MIRKHTKIGFAVAVTAALVAGGSALANTDDTPPIRLPEIPAYDAGEQPDGPEELATNCRFDFAYRNDVPIRTFNWCFSDDGNIVSIENSAGLEHVAIGTILEGWCVSAFGSVRGISWGGYPNEGLGAPIYTNTKKVAHRTTDGTLRVESSFGTSPGNKKMVVTMKVRNVTNNPLNDVFLTRFIDADLSNSAVSDEFVQADRSVMAYEAGSARLELIPESYFYNANSLVYDSFEPSFDGNCYDATADGNTTDAGDRSMGVHYQIGTIFPGQDKTLRFAYRISI